MSLFSKNHRLIAFGLCLLGLAGLGAAQTNISNSPNWYSSCPRLTVDPYGNVHAVWAEFYTMNFSPTSGDAFYSKYSAATQAWSAPINLSNSGLCFSWEWYVVGIDSDPAGNVYVVYVSGTRLMLRILSGGAWSAPFEVGSGPGSGVDGARVAVDAQGNIFVCWYDNDYGIVYSRARVGGVWENVIQLSNPARSKFPEIAVGTNSVYCVWMDSSSGYAYFTAFSVRARTFGAGWAAPRRVTSGSEAEEHPAIKVDAADVAHIVYTPYFSDGTRAVRYVSGTSAGWSAPLGVGSRGGVHYPSIGLRGGSLYVVWKWDMGRVYTNERKAGVWIGEAAVPGSGSCDLPDVAISPAQDKVYYAWDTGAPCEIYVGVKTQYVAPVEPSKHAVGDFDGDSRDEVAVDFGTLGVWLANETGWNQISTNNPDGLLAADVTGDGTEEIVVDFGLSGLWIMVGGAWHSISSRNPEAILAGKLNGSAAEGLIVDFGSLGLWTWDGLNWAQLSGANPVSLAAGDVDSDGADEIVSGFASAGLWLWNAGAWVQLNGVAPQAIAIGDMDGGGGEEIVADFGALGVWVRNGGAWIRLSPADAEALVLGDVDGNGSAEVLGDFGTWGLFIWINDGWVNLTAYDPDRVIAADVDGDGRDEVVGDFGAFGLWVWDGANWVLMSHINAENIMAGDADGNGSDEVLADFGPLGLWGWYGGAWYQISGANPD